MKYTLIALCLLIPLVVSDVRPSRVSYGGSCNRTARCDTRAWLRCVDGVCDCMKPEEMVYDADSAKCLAKAGERCKYALGESEVPGLGFLFEVHSCVGNSTCSQEGICNCDSGFYETSEGYCAKSKEHGEACSEEVKCFKDKGLQCQDGTCGCDPATSEYRHFALEHRGQCVGLAGSQCIGSRCTEYARCSTNMCVCNDGFYWDVTGRCVRKIGIFGNCSADFQCQQTESSKLKCVKGVCNCDPATSVYAAVQPSHQCNHVGTTYQGYEGSKSAPQCVPLAGLRCKNRLCAPRSYCSYDNQLCHGYWYSDEDLKWRGYCKCNPGLTKSKSNHCGSGFLGECNSGDECIDGLVCKNRVCSCELDIQAYDNQTKTCYNKIGGPCSDSTDCAANAHCEVSDTGSDRGHCQCNEGFVPNADGICEATLGGDCEDSRDCDSIAGLQCINNVCRCGTFAIFNEKERKCLGKVGAGCKLGSTNDCIEHATCTEVHPKLPGSCNCKAGYVETGNYTCVAVEILDAAVGNGSNEVETEVSN